MIVQLIKKNNFSLLRHLSILLLIFIYLWHFIYIYIHGYIKIFPYSDADFYLHWVKTILAGKVAVPFVGLPGYPFFVSLFYRVIPSVVFVVFIQHLLMIVTGYLVFKIMERLSNVFWASLTVLCYLVYTPFLMYSSILTPEPVALFFLASWFYLFMKEEFSIGDSVLSGLLGGILIITRPAFLLWLVAMGVFLPIRFIKNKSKAIVFGCLYYFFLYVPIFMIMLINHAYTGSWELSAHAGINFYIGNSNIASGLFYTGGIFRPTQAGMLEDSRIIASKLSGHALSFSQASAFWFRKAFDFIVTNPGKFLMLLGKKFLLLFNGTEYHDANWQAMHMTVLPFLNFSFIFPLSFIGLWTTRKNAVIGILRLCFVLTTLATILVFINSRYKLMVVLPAIMLATLALRDLVFLYKNRRIKELMVLLFLVIMLIIIGNICWVPNLKDTVAIKFNRAMQILEDGKIFQAQHMFQDLVKKAPNDYMSWFALGNTYYYLHKLRQAQQCYIKALKLNPWFADALFNLSMVYLNTGQYKLAEDGLLQLYSVSPTKEDVIYNLIRVEAKLGNCKRAINLLEKFIGLWPDDKDKLKPILGKCLAVRSI